MQIAIFDKDNNLIAVRTTTHNKGEFISVFPNGSIFSTRVRTIDITSIIMNKVKKYDMYDML